MFRLLPFLFLSLLAPITAAPVHIDSGHPILDDNGHFVHAHGGGLIKSGDYYYWFGENRNFNGDDSFHAVSCYRSTNLRDWEFRNHVLRSNDDVDLDYSKIERPKVIYNPITKRFVMWMHKEWGSHYGEARAAVASCDTVDGNYIYHGSFRPLGTHMSRDCTLFVDDDGAGYFISAANNNADLNLYRLNPDFLNVASLVKVISPGLSRESPCLFKRNGRYFIIGSGTTGWSPNQAKYATATSLSGTWSTPANLGNNTTYRSQSAYVLTIPGTAGNEYLYIGDRWARAWGDYTGFSHYVFLPLHFPTDSIMTMEDAEHVTVDTESGYLASGFGGWEKIDNRSSRISYSAGWGSYFGNTGFAQSEHFSETNGAQASFTFYGDQFRVHGFRRNDLGRMEILLNGVSLTTIDCYQSSAAYNVELYQSALLTRGTHTVTVRVAGTKNASSSGTEIIVDAFSSRDSQSLAATPSGSSRIISSHSGKDLTETPGIAPLKQFTWGAQPGQTWQLNPQADGSHHLTRADGSGWVGIAGASTADGAAIALSSSPQDAFSRWQLLPTPGGAFTLRNAGSSRLADVSDGSRNEGAAVIQYSANSGENQRWHLRPERNPGFASQQIIEAETAASQPSFAPFAVEAAGAGPGATSIRVPESTGLQTTAPATGLCNYPFSTSAPSTRVRYWILAHAADSDDDDLHFRENNDSWTTVRLQQHPTDFFWNYLGESQLPAGSHTLSLGWRDDGVRIDKIMLQRLPDSDGDGLDDLREAGLGTSIGLTDSDQDGHDDFMEVAFGTSPTNASSLVTVTAEVSPDQAGVFRIRWPSISGNVYQIEQWQDNPGQPWTPIAERTADSSITEFSIPMTEPRMLLRVRAMPTPSP